MNTGYIYIISNLNNLLNKVYKVGKTTNLKSRLNSYNTGRQNSECYYYIEVFKVTLEHLNEIEKVIHNTLGIYRFENKNEMYQVNLSVLISSISNVVSNITNKDNSNAINLNEYPIEEPMELYIGPVLGLLNEKRYKNLMNASVYYTDYTDYIFYDYIYKYLYTNYLDQIKENIDFTKLDDCDLLILYNGFKEFIVKFDRSNLTFDYFKDKIKLNQCNSFSSVPYNFDPLDLDNCVFGLTTINHLVDVEKLIKYFIKTSLKINTKVYNLNLIDSRLIDLMNNKEVCYNYEYLISVKSCNCKTHKNKGSIEVSFRFDKTLLDTNCNETCDKLTLKLLYIDFV